MDIREVKPNMGKLVQYDTRDGVFQGILNKVIMNQSYVYAKLGVTV